MLLTITTTYRPATDLGYLLHKNPARCQRFEESFGAVHVFYPEASANRFGYSVRFLGVGPEDPTLGPPTQMAVFGARRTNA